jgi:hypothetical protein
MRLRLCLLLAVALCLTAAHADPIKIPNQGLKTYKGAWFDVQYPLGFKVVPRQKSATNAEGYDAVSFLSADGLVEFYVYSPQWSGTSDWTKRRSGEKLTSKSTEQAGDQTITYVTFKGPGYTRSYADYRQPQYNVRWVFGYRYKHSAAYHAYRNLYLQFKQSLKQFAD